MKLKPLEEIHVMKVPRRQPQRKRPKEEVVEPVLETPAEPVLETPAEPVLETPAEPVLETPAEPVLETPLPEEVVEEKPASKKPTFATMEEKIQLLKRFQERIQKREAYYQIKHPNLWKLYEELQELLQS
jgi:hypothetical protein